MCCSVAADAPISHHSVQGLARRFIPETSLYVSYATAGTSAITPHGFCRILPSRKSEALLRQGLLATSCPDCPRVSTNGPSPRELRKLLTSLINDLSHCRDLSDNMFCQHPSSVGSHNAFQHPRRVFGAVYDSGKWVCKPWEVLGSMQRPRSLVGPEIF